MSPAALRRSRDPFSSAPSGRPDDGPADPAGARGPVHENPGLWTTCPRTVHDSCPRRPGGQRGRRGCESPDVREFLSDVAAEPADRAAGETGARVQLQVRRAAVRAAVEAVVGKEVAAQAPAVCRARREGEGSARSAEGGGARHVRCGTFPDRVPTWHAGHIVRCRSLDGEWSRSGRGVRAARERVVGCSNLRRARCPAARMAHPGRSVKRPGIGRHAPARCGTTQPRRERRQLRRCWRGRRSVAALAAANAAAPAAHFTSSALISPWNGRPMGVRASHSRYSGSLAAIWARDQPA